MTLATVGRLVFLMYAVWFFFYCNLQLITSYVFYMDMDQRLFSHKIVQCYHHAQPDFILYCFLYAINKLSVTIIQCYHDVSYCYYYYCLLICSTSCYYTVVLTTMYSRTTVVLYYCHYYNFNISLIDLMIVNTVVESFTTTVLFLYHSMSNFKKTSN
jgi:hypothetical protein